MTSILLALAGLMGAVGVVLTAAAAHGKQGTGLDSAGYLLLIHAVAIVAGTAALRSGLLLRPLGLVVLFGFVAGGSLFAGDVALRAARRPACRLTPFPRLFRPADAAAKRRRLTSIGMTVP